jgi:single-strand DNA-binding protein
MMQASAYGRLAADPRAIATKTGKAMSVVGMAVDVDGEANGPLWIDVVAFGRVAEELLRHTKGDLLSVCGKIQRHTWADRDGNQRDKLQIIADAVISARTTRPSGGRKKQEATS